jgi:pSer/pThr/pTyr-binding forkhead associated (FHA) protein
MKIRLIERGATPDETHEVSVNQPEFLVGRGTDCDLRLRSSSVSRHHCVIRVTADETTVVDLGSSNGTFLNDRPVRSPTTLHTGDALKIGTRLFVVDLGDQPTTGASEGTDLFTRTVKVKSPPKGNIGPP